MVYNIIYYSNQQLNNIVKSDTEQLLNALKASLKIIIRIVILLIIMISKIIYIILKPILISYLDISKI